MTVRVEDNMCSLQFRFPDFVDTDNIEISLDGGMSFPYSTPDNVGQYTIATLPNESIEVFVRYPNNPSVQFGQVCIPSDCVLSSDVNLSLQNDCIQVFPNPTNGILYIQVESQEYRIKIINQQGNILQSYDTIEDMTIDISTLPTGLHFIEVMNSNHSKVYLKKILKQ